MITPSPYQIKHYFNHLLRYSDTALKDKSDTNQFHMLFCKQLNHSDNPLFEDLAGINCFSYILVDTFRGQVLDAWFSVNKGKAIRSYNEAGFKNENLVNVLKYHFNLVNVSKEYIAGGWLKGRQVLKELKLEDDKITWVKKFDCRGLLEKCKPWNKEEKE